MNSSDHMDLHIWTIRKCSIPDLDLIIAIRIAALVSEEEEDREGERYQGAIWSFRIAAIRT